MAPHYLRFARALAFVSVALPVPVIAADTLLGCTGGPGGTQEPGPGQGIEPSPGTAPSPGEGVPVAPGVAPAPGVTVGPPTGVAPCSSAVCGVVDAGPDATDASDSGGPSLGLPELPASWNVESRDARA